MPYIPNRSLVLMPTPGATTEGNVVEDVRPQVVGPRLEKLAIVSAPSTAPTEKAPGPLAGLAEEPTVGPKFPAANTGTIPALRSTAMSEP